MIPAGKDWQGWRKLGEPVSVCSGSKRLEREGDIGVIRIDVDSIGTISISNKVGSTIDKGMTKKGTTRPMEPRGLNLQPVGDDISIVLCQNVGERKLLMKEGVWIAVSAHPVILVTVEVGTEKQSDMAVRGVAPISLVIEGASSQKRGQVSARDGQPRKRSRQREWCIGVFKYAMTMKRALLDGISWHVMTWSVVNSRNGTKDESYNLNPSILSGQTMGLVVDERRDIRIGSLQRAHQGPRALENRNMGVETEVDREFELYSLEVARGIGLSL
ncbi:hypothetical protein Sjap_020276 [Stephania japonica]|uniref:Uncharacterized protein n=1 Tax=Stephania japonica TaxID=461633 RepID=A0AAP0F5W6_9MAGN